MSAWWRKGEQLTREFLRCNKSKVHVKTWCDYVWTCYLVSGLDSKPLTIPIFGSKSLQFISCNITIIALISYYFNPQWYKQVTTEMSRTWTRRLSFYSWLLWKVDNGPNSSRLSLWFLHTVCSYIKVYIYFSSHKHTHLVFFLLLQPCKFPHCGINQVLPPCDSFSWKKPNNCNIILPASP